MAIKVSKDDYNEIFPDKNRDDNLVDRIASIENSIKSLESALKEIQDRLENTINQILP